MTENNLIEPIYIEQATVEPENSIAWVEEQAAKAREMGCGFFRASVHQQTKQMLLEGSIDHPGDQRVSQWKKRPF